jgi:hypothetical protein
MDIVKQTLEKFKAILENLSITDEQSVALSEALTAINKETIDKLASMNEEISSLKKQSEVAPVSKYSDAQIEKAFEMFEADCEKAAQGMVEEAKAEFAKQLAEGLHDLYEDVEKRVKKEFENSTEFKALKAVVESVAPIAGASDEATRKKVDDLQKQLDEVNKKNSELQFSEAVNELIADYSGAKKDKLKDYLEGAKSVEEVYERYAAIAEILEEGSSAPTKTTPTNEDASLTAEGDDEEEEDVEDEDPDLGDVEDEEEEEETEDDDDNFNEDFIQSSGANLTGLNKSQQEALAWLAHAKQSV